ncbi:MAG: methyltransferase domain-containing protein [Nanoarchaeota archaeon]|nr:methyltransferase domain-containing protein [Nanoarchaeota archaeon]
MKLKESGMPEENMWKEFFKPDKILKKLGLNTDVENAADLGCGYGTFSIPAAKIVRGKVFAIDIESEMVKETERKARENNLSNVETILRDFVLKGSGLKDESVNYAMVFNILYTNGRPEKLLKEAYRILKPGGKVGIIHWNYDSATPRGPPMEIRPKPEQCIKWAESVGFKLQQRYDLKPYHYGIVMEKRK